MSASSTSRKIQLAPNYAPVELKEEIELLGKEIGRIKPKVEITLKDTTSIAKGIITKWVKDSKYFKVRIEKRSPQFDEVIDHDSSAMAYIKVHLLSSQIVFKTHPVRHPKSNEYDFRIPKEFYKQQRRGAMRVPTDGLKLKARATFLIQKHNEVCTARITDLSITGARLRTTSYFPKVPLMKPVELDLVLPTGTLCVDAKVTSWTEKEIGCKFIEMDQEKRILIKQVLIDALKIYFDARSMIADE